MSECQIPGAKRTPNSIHIALFKGETAQDDFATWPPSVQNLHTRALDGWAARNPDLDIIEQTHSFDGGFRVCVTEFHVAPKVAP